MSHTSSHRSKNVPDSWGQEGEHRRKLAHALNGVLRGETNNHFTVTLDPDATSTEVSFEPSRTGATPVLSPLSAAGATAIATGQVYAVASDGKVTIHHDSSSDIDRQVALVILG